MDFLIVVFGLVIALVIGAFISGQKHTSKKLLKTIPGPTPGDAKQGNFPDIIKAGSLHHFLTDMHTRYGDVIQIWFGEKRVISTASPESFKDQMRLFDKPEMSFIEPVFGNRGVQFVNGDEAKQRRRDYDVFLNTDSVHQYFHVFKEVVDNHIVKLKQLEDGAAVNVYEIMFRLSCKAVGVTLFGDYFLDDDNVEKFRQLYSKFWPVLEKNFTNGLPVERTEERIYFDSVVSNVHDMARDLIASRKGRKDRKFIDVVMETGNDDITTLGDVLVYLVGGFHSTSITLTWCIYHASKYPDTCKQIHEELSHVFENSDFSPTALQEMRYLRCFINETLRLRFVAPIATRKSGETTVIGGYQIPPNTDIIQALSVVLTSDSQWETPEVFNPERFIVRRNTESASDGNSKRSPLAFCPFGFAGRRKCPGQKFFFEEATVFLSSLLYNFEFRVTDDRDVTITYGLLTRPEDDIFATLKKRRI